MLPEIRGFYAETGVVDQITGGEDRKSTRLNSSHSQISYAVFCLKKKKKTERSDRREQRLTHEAPAMPGSRLAARELESASRRDRALDPTRADRVHGLVPRCRPRA